MTAKGFQGIDRETYKQTKKMDREKMSQFLTDIYDMGYKDGLEAQCDLKELASRILAINGIGYTRAAKIMEVLEDYFNKKESNSVAEITEE